MISEHFLPNLQPRYGQNGIGNLEHDHIYPYLTQNYKLNGGLRRDKKIQKKRAKDRMKHRLTANVYNTKFDIIKHVLEQTGFTLNENECFKNNFLIWADSTVNQEKLSELKSYQRLNHFLGMAEISRKDYFARKFFKMQKLRPDDYNYFPKTWLFPQERNVFQIYLKETKDLRHKKYFIIKPSNGAMGCGIRLVSEDDPIKVQDSSIVQQYIDRPFLLDGFKNDLRIYVLITCCDPLRAFIYREGLVRLSTEKYVMSNDLKSESLYMHLTNYSINKKNSNYTKSQDENNGSKRSLTYFMNFLRTKYNVNVDSLWRSIIAIVVKTLILVQPHLLHNYRMCRPGQLPISDSVCFEILGFDILLDEKFRPWLLEVNRSPSFGMNETLDRKVKGDLLEDTLRLLNIRPTDKTKYANLQKQRASRRLTLAAVKSRIDTQLSYDLSKKRKIIDKKKQEFIDLLIKTRANASREYFENRNVGKFSRIFPPEDKNLQEEYHSILTDSFLLFNQIHSGTTAAQTQAMHSTGSNNNPSVLNNSTANDPMSNARAQALQCFQMSQEREEILVEKIKQCEEEENKILMKANLPKNAQQTTLIPMIDFYETSSDESSSSESDSSELSASASSISGVSGTSKQSLINKQKTPPTPQDRLATDKSNTTSLGNRTPSNPSLSQKTLAQRNKTPSRGNSQNSNKSNKSPSARPPSVEPPAIAISSRNSSRNSMKRTDRKKSRSSSSSDSSSSSSSSRDSKNKSKSKNHSKNIDSDDVVNIFIESRQKNTVVGPELYQEILKIILTGLKTLSIRYPGQDDNLTKTMLQKIQNNWEIYRKSVANYWLINLNSKKRENVLEIVKNNVNSIINDNMEYSGEFFKAKLQRLLDKLYNRLLWNRGHGLMQCFNNFGSWKLIFCGSNEDNLRSLEQNICARVVQLCLDCVVIVYHFSLNLVSSSSQSSCDNTKAFLVKDPLSLTGLSSQRNDNIKIGSLTSLSTRHSFSNMPSNTNKRLKPLNRQSTTMSMASRSSIAIVPYQ